VIEEVFAGKMGRVTFLMVRVACKKSRNILLSLFAKDSRQQHFVI
jgi:hypothetical protein